MNPYIPESWPEVTKDTFFAVMHWLVYRRSGRDDHVFYRHVVPMPQDDRLGVEIRSENRYFVNPIYIKCHGVARYKTGDVVDMLRWNQYDPPSKRFKDPVIVAGIRFHVNCESGVMITVKDAEGRVREVDQNWLKPEITVE